MGSILFCPFCRESFDDVGRCPEHELELVSWQQLPRQPRALDPNQRVAMFSLRMGRGPVWVGAICCLVGFLLPLATMHAEVTLAGSMLSLALSHTIRLWLVPAGALALLLVLARRRTPALMRAARVVTPLLALVPLIGIGTTFLGVLEAAARLEEKTRMAVTVDLGAGSYLVAFGSLVALIGSTRLGVQAQPSPD